MTQAYAHRSPITGRHQIVCNIIPISRRGRTIRRQVAPVGLDQPGIYADWSPLFDRFAQGDDSALETMETGTIEWTDIVAERWTRLVANCLASRLGDLSKELRNRLVCARNQADVDAAVRWTNGRLVPLNRLCRLPCLDGKVREYLDDACSHWVSRTRMALRSGAQAGTERATFALAPAAALARFPLTWPPTVNDLASYR